MTSDPRRASFCGGAGNLDNKGEVCTSACTPKSLFPLDTQLLSLCLLCKNTPSRFPRLFFPPTLSSIQSNMLRNGASRLALRSVAGPTAARSAANFTRTAPSLQWKTQFGSLAAKRPQLAQTATALKPASSAILRRCMADVKLTEEQKQAESRYRNEEIKPTPETVTSTSTTHPIFSEVGAEASVKEVDMMAGVKHDVVCITVFYNSRHIGS